AGPDRGSAADPGERDLGRLDRGGGGAAAPADLHPAERRAREDQHLRGQPHAAARGGARGAAGRAHRRRARGAAAPHRTEDGPPVALIAPPCASTHSGSGEHPVAVGRAPDEMTDETTTTKRAGLSPIEVGAGAGAAVIAAFASSYLGTAGTLTGAAVASVVGTVSTSVLRSSAQTSAHRLKQTTTRLRDTRVDQVRATDVRPVESE